MLESPADGIGVWACSEGLTVVCNVGTPTFPAFLRLCEGDFGAGPTQADHMLVAVNCSWGRGQDVGQLWDRCAAAFRLFHRRRAAFVHFAVLTVRRGHLRSLLRGRHVAAAAAAASEGPRTGA